MNWCIDCHRHPESALRPHDHITDMDWSPSREEQERIGRDIAISLTVAPTLDCSGCHR
jgi:menaquinone reductase, multiheme cytochrome c subunit